MTTGKIRILVLLGLIGSVVLLGCALAFSFETNLIYPGSKLVALKNTGSHIGWSGLVAEVESDFTTQASPSDVFTWYEAKQWSSPLGYCPHCYEVNNHYFGIGFGMGIMELRWKLVLLINSTSSPIEIYQLNSFEINISLRPH